MKKLLVIGIILISLPVAGYIARLAYLDYSLRNPESITVEYTKDEYMQEIRRKTNDPVVICSYELLIDRYGTNETLKMDLRAVSDETDVDQRIYDALEECL